MKKRFLLLLLITLTVGLKAHGQNFQSIIKEVKTSVESNVNKIYIHANWGDAALERISLEYIAGTNNGYELKIKDALINQSTVAVSAVVSKDNGFMFSTEQSDILTELSMIDTVGEDKGKVAYMVTLKWLANRPIEAKIVSLSDSVLEIVIAERKIPNESLNTAENSFSNTTTNTEGAGRVTFNPDGTPYIVPTEIASSPRKGLTDDNPQRKTAPVTSAVEQPSGQEGAGGNLGTPENNANYTVICCDKDGKQSAAPVGADGKTAVNEQQSGRRGSSPASFYSSYNEDGTGNTDKVYIDESVPGGSKILHENPALLNVMIIASEKRRNDALKLSVILNKEKRVAIQNRLGLSFRVVNVSVTDRAPLSETTIFYRKKYLKPAIVLSDEIDGNQKVLKMVNPEKKIGVDVEIILGDY